MILVFYRLNSAIERGTKPDAVGWKPCHWTSTLKAAMVNASRAWKYSQPRCMTFLKWQTTVSIESTVSTSIWSSHAPRGHSLRLAGSPSAAWKPVSLRTIQIPSDLVVKLQAIDIVEVVFSLLWRRNIAQTSCRNGKTRFELPSPWEAHWSTT